jgi:hypothetical protein
MRPSFVAVGLAVLLATNVAGQNDTSFEYGSIEELRTVKMIFVDAREDLDLRNIIKTILEKNLDMAVVDRPEDAEYVVFFTWWDGGSTGRAKAVVAKRLNAERFRILSNYRGREEELNDMADEYAKWLVKQIKRVRNPAG